jgi:hypothetical protein
VPGSDPRSRETEERTIVVARFRVRFGGEAFEIVERVAKVRGDRAGGTSFGERVALKDLDARARSAQGATPGVRACDERMLRYRSREREARERRPVLEAARP